MLHAGHIIALAISTNDAIKRPMVSRRRSHHPYTDTDRRDDDVHLFIWNDLSHGNNLYPNLMEHAQEGSELMHPAPQAANLLTSLLDSDEELPPPVPTRATLSDSVKSAILKTMNFDLFGTGHLKAQPAAITLHKKRMNEDDDDNDRYNRGDLLWNIEQPAILRAFRKWPMLNEQAQDTPYPPFEYYTNKVNRRPDKLAKSVGYEIGELPVFSGRLLANEPIPQYHHTFKFFEPVPTQVMLPPPKKKIPEFKPVPPRLQMIPVIDEYLNKRPNRLRHNEYAPNVGPANKTLRMMADHRQRLLTPSALLIPFEASEALAMPAAPSRTPKIERLTNFTAAPTEPYQQHTNINGITRGHKLEPNETGYTHAATNVPAAPATHRPYTGHPWRSPATANIVTARNQTASPSRYYDTVAYGKLLSALAKAMPNIKQQPDNVDPIYPHQLGAIEKISTYDPKPQNWKQKHEDHQPLDPNAQQQQKPWNSNSMLDDLVVRRKVKHAGEVRQQSQRQYGEKANTTTTTTTLTAGKMHASKQNSADNTSSGQSTETAEESDKNSAIEPFEAHVIDGKAVDTVQLSETYTRQTSNVRARNNGSISVVVKWPNEPNKALKVSDATIRSEDDRGHSGEATTENPFLIAVYGSNGYDHTNSANTLIDRSTTLVDSIDRSDILANGIGAGSQDEWAKITVPKWHAVQTTNEASASDALERPAQAQAKHKSLTIAADSGGQLAANHRYNDMDTALSVSAIDANESINVTTIYPIVNDHKYYDWFSAYAAKRKQSGRKLYSEHFRKVEIEPNVAWVNVPR